MKAFFTLYLMMFINSAFTNRSLNEFNQQMNNHPVSTENNQSPLQMWERGMLENMHSGHSALSPEEIQDFRVDLYLGGALSVEEEDYQVNVLSPTIELTDQHLTQMPSPLQNDENCGVNIFKQRVELNHSFFW